MAENEPHYLMIEWFIQYILHNFISFFQLSGKILAFFTSFHSLSLSLFFLNQQWHQDKTAQPNCTNRQPQWKMRFRGRHQSHCKSEDLTPHYRCQNLGCFSENYGWAHKWNLKLSIIHKTCNNSTVKCNHLQNKRWKLS